MSAAYFSEVCTFLDYQVKNTDLLYQAFSYGASPAEEAIDADASVNAGTETLAVIGSEAMKLYLLKNVTDHYGTYENRDDDSYGTGSFLIRGGMNPEEYRKLSEKVLSDSWLSERVRGADILKFRTEGVFDGREATSDKTGAYETESEKSDAALLKALVGAVALDSRFNPGVLQNTVRKALSVEDFLEELPPEPEKIVKVTLESAVNRLKELGDKGVCSAPDYQFDSPDTIGEDVNGTPVWYCKCTVESMNLVKGAFAVSKKNAKKCASYLVLCDYYGQENELGDDPDLLEYQVKMP